MDFVQTNQGQQTYDLDIKKDLLKKPESNYSSVGVQYCMTLFKYDGTHS